MLHITQQKEQFSLAFIRAIAAVSGFNIVQCEVDDDSIDIGLRGSRRDGGVRKAPQLDLQMKCTELDDGQGEFLAYDLKIKNYDDLRSIDRHIPAILVVVVVPDVVSDWLTETPEHTAMRRCAYWVSLRGRGPAAGSTQCRVQVPRTQRFTAEEVRTLMARIGNGGDP